MVFAISIKRAAISTTEAHVQIGHGTVSSVRVGVLLRVSTDTSDTLPHNSDEEL